MATSEHLLLRLSHWDSQWQPDPRETYGLVVAHSLKKGAAGSHAIAVLGSVNKGTSSSGEQYHRLDHICQAAIQKRTGSPPADVESLSANELEEMEWLVC